ncbi:MAG: hypothetical protein NTY66_03200 [Candidatus Vogelbacteria bacterium]|nr:hypothetical protein [Candidatus Vogelbacteria bacterium]
MNKYQRLEAKHSQDKYIVTGIVVALVIIGGLMVWLSTFAPQSKRPVTDPTATTTLPIATSTVPVGTTTAGKPLSADKITGLAKFLAAQGIKMYGAAWCTHCADQKAAFGEAFKLITYVECPENTKICLAAGVEGYPTWRKPNGDKIEGFTPLDKLATWAGYKY